MRYFATASGPKVREVMAAGVLGQICTPLAGNVLMPGVDWCADNAAFGNSYPGDGPYLAWLDARRWALDRCAFAVAPDVVGDAAATLARSLPMLPQIRARGYRVAYAAQNGARPEGIPWREFDALFIGGDTPWKLGPQAFLLAQVARGLGKWVHMGRVNSKIRIDYAREIGCDSVDGTYLAFGPDKNLPRLLRWLASAA